MSTVKLSQREHTLVESMIQQALKIKHSHDRALRAALSASRQNKLVATVTTTQNTLAAGKVLFDTCFEQLNQRYDTALQWALFHSDGTSLKPNSLMLRLEGPTDHVVTFAPYFADRLNRLSNIATFTQTLARATAPCKITYSAQHTHELHDFEILGALTGGAFENQFFTEENIYVNDWAFQIAENHQTLFESIQSRRSTTTLVTIEVVSFLDLKYALMAKPDRVVLKNFTPVEIERAVQFFSTACTIFAEVIYEPNNASTFAATEVDGLIIKNLFNQPVEDRMRVEYLFDGK